MLLTWLLPSVIVAQNYSVPTGWQNTASNVSRVERLSIASGIAEELRHRADPSTGATTDSATNGTVWIMAIVLADLDRLSGNTTSEDSVNNTLLLIESGQERLDGVNTDNAGFGLAEMYAYLAYGNSSRLDMARSIFDLIYSDLITDTAVQSNKYPRPIPTTCQGTLGGLVFNTHSNASDLTVYGFAIAPWIALCARLYETTQNSTYLDAAEASIRFMQTYMVKVVDSGIEIYHTFNLTGCDTLSVAASAPSGDDVGRYIEGLSIVANVTANQTYSQMLDTLVPAVVSFRDWHSGEGILTKDTTTFPSKGSLIRGLLEARLRNPSNTALGTLIDSYLTVQFNAVQTNAKLGSNDYAISWLGGGSSSYTTVGNEEALDVLNAASVIAPVDASQPNKTSSTNHRRASAGIIAGATISGIVALAAVALLLCVRIRRRNRTGEAPVHNDGIDAVRGVPAGRAAALMPEPFILHTSLHDQSTLVSEKGRSQQRARVAQDTLGDAGDNVPSSPPSDQDVSQNLGAREVGSTDNHPEAWDDLERRLETRLLNNLMRTFAGHGETESNPPEYDEPRN
ncbi:unnamed protein product [Peniophora sp. CBMAI 1063]|nr:unnamed protein product [Peniophora sp. CBMAI 1063]